MGFGGGGGFGLGVVAVEGAGYVSDCFAARVVDCASVGGGCLPGQYPGESADPGSRTA